MRFFLVLSLALVATTAFAQETKLALGGGLTFNRVKTEHLPGGIDEKVAVGLNAGARLLTSINEQWSFRTGLYLQEKALKYSFDTMGLEGDITARMIQAALPINIQYKISDAISVFGGYVLDYNINGYCNASGDATSCSIGHFKQIVHNATVGVSVFVNDKLDIDASYQHGLTEVFEDVKVHTLLVQGLVKF